MSDEATGAESANEEGAKPDADAATADAGTQPKGAKQEGTAKTSEGEATDWKSHARTWEDRAKASSKEVADLKAELDEFREAQMTETEKAIKAARKEAADEVHKEYRTKLVRANIIAAAAGEFAHPEDAPRYFDDLGSIDPEDGEAISKGLADILESRPELAGLPAKAKGSVDGGVKTQEEVDLGSLSMDDYIEQRNKRRAAG